ncbi:MAG: DHH family phosphoesterase [Acidobacteriota bacterium]|nr:DHH family phosphoesterase [Acidobacteriota bacterium]
MDCKVFYHDKCFDGACSASLFTRFHRECIRTASQYSYQGLVHRAGALFDEADLGDGENAIVDFKYLASPRITWWFDHHLSAFMTPEDEADFRRGQADGSQSLRRFYDASYTSCTGLIADVARERFGMDTRPLEELIYWANIVDGAKYESASAAVEMAAPAMKLTAVIESATDPALGRRLIPLLTEMPLQQVLEQEFVQQQLGPLMERHWAALQLIRDRATVQQGVITFDITDQPTEGYNKFIPYYLHPEATYNVGLSKSSFRVKVSVGTNPWTPRPASELINLAAMCERYGGGGHARVGAISFPVDQEQEARAAARQIVDELALGRSATAN